MLCAAFLMADSGVVSQIWLEFSIRRRRVGCGKLGRLPKFCMVGREFRRGSSAGPARRPADETDLYLYARSRNPSALVALLAEVEVRRENRCCRRAFRLYILDMLVIFWTFFSSSSA